MSKNRLALLAVSLVALALGLWVGAASGGRDAAHAFSFQQVASGFSSPVDVASAPGAVGKIASLTSFGEDGNGELYAVSGDGTLFALRS